MRAVRLLHRSLAVLVSVCLTVAVALAAALVALTLPVAVPAAEASQPVPGHTGLVPSVPRADTPMIADGEILDMAVVGTGADARVFVAGTFTSITDKVGPGTTLSQSYLASYHLQSGLVDTDFRPQFGGGGVNAVEASPDGSKLFVAGSFDSIDGVPRQKVASLDLTTGAPLSSFAVTRSTNKAATALAVSSSKVYVGGRFSRINGVLRTGLAALSPSTGAVDTGFDEQIAGGIGVKGALTVQQLKLTHDGSKLLVVHTGRQIHGSTRLGIGLIDTKTKTLLPWRTRLWDDNLPEVGGVIRVYAADIAPDDSYFVVTSGSGGDHPPISDTAVAFPLTPTAVASSDVAPLWVHRAFDSTYSVAITEKAVYIGGHFRWNESPTSPDPWPGLDTVGYGTGQGLSGYGLGDEVVRRDQLGALDPATGKALEWDPGSDAFEGNKAMVAFAGGLLVGGDGRRQGGVKTGRVAYYDLSTAAAPSTPDTTIKTPIEGRVVSGSSPFAVTGEATVSADQGSVAEVDVLVQDRDTHLFLQPDGTWGATHQRFHADLGASGTDVPWSLSTSVSGNHTLELTATTLSSGGDVDATPAVKKIESFQLEDQTPATAITGPTTPVVSSTSFTMSGTATDDHGVDALSYWFRDAQGRYLQSDGTVGPLFTTFRGLPDVVGAPHATWSTRVVLPHEGVWRGSATAIDTAGQSDLRSAIHDWTVDTDARAPDVTITKPATMTPPLSSPTVRLSPGAPLTFSGTASDTGKLTRVEVALRNTTTHESLGADGTWGAGITAGWHRVTPVDVDTASYRWTWTTPFSLTPGTYSFAVRAVDHDGLVTSTTRQGRLALAVQVPGDAVPTVSLDGASSTPVPVQDPSHPLSGSAGDDVGVRSVDVSVFDSDTGRYLQDDGSLSATYHRLSATLAAPGARSTRWSLPLRLPSAGSWTVVASATDTSAQQNTSTTNTSARLTYYPGDAAPILDPNLGQPVDGTAFADGRIVVTGRALDDLSIARVEVGVVDAAGRYLDGAGGFGATASWRPAFLTSPGSAGSNYSWTSPIVPAGTYTVLVRPTDNHGQIGAVRTSTVTVTHPSNSPPVAHATVACDANVCTFDARGSTDEDASSLSYAWSFGTGQGRATGAVPVKTFTAPGRFVVGLTVTDEWGATGSTHLTVPVVEPRGNTAPVARFAVRCDGRVCSVANTGTEDPDPGDVLANRWTWGDGSPTSKGPTAQHAYSRAGTYRITLSVHDGWGNTATRTHTVTVTGPSSVAAVPTR